ncbi:MAG: hypothetical protein QOI30_1860 [Mycobacterium sp.]|nr:hypothetical protein [Mycobacterium sp.]
MHAVLLATAIRSHQASPATSTGSAWAEPPTSWEESTSSPREPDMSKPQPTHAAVASMIAPTVETYDFFIYGTAAALVFNKVFFPAFDGLVGILISLSTFTVAFLVQPIGGIVIGHLGNRIGRKPMLVFTRTAMGVRDSAPRPAAWLMTRPASPPRSC